MRIFNKNLSGHKVEIYSFLGAEYLALGQNSFFLKFFAETRRTKSKIAGFYKEEYLKANIQNQVFGGKKTLKSLDFSKTEKEAVKIIFESLQKASKILPSKQTLIYLLPTQKDFIVKKM